MNTISGMIQMGLCYAMVIFVLAISCVAIAWVVEQWINMEDRINEESDEEISEWWG